MSLFYDDDDDDYIYDDDEDDDEWPRPEWLHADCADPCTALDLGTCCKYPSDPVVRRAVEIADAVARALNRVDREDCADDADGAGDAAGTAAVELSRLLRSVPGLLAQIHAVAPAASKMTVAQLLCPVGRLTSAFDQVRDDGCQPGSEPVAALLRECSAALWSALRNRAAALTTWIDLRNARA